MPDPAPHRYAGARALIELHARHLRQFAAVWQRARSAGVEAPATDDPNCASLNETMHHVLSVARWYMVWICQSLGLPDPMIDEAPSADQLTAEIDNYLTHLEERWAEPLADQPTECFFDREYATPWNAKYCVDAMLEHAVMHPIRHERQVTAWERTLK